MSKLHGRAVVLGGGHGVAAVLRALRDEPLELTIVVTTADDGGSSGELRRRRGGPAVGDLRRSLLTLAGEGSALGRALGRTVTLPGYGEHPLGNLVIESLADAFGDLQVAIEWLGEQLGVSARVLPAALTPIHLVAETRDEVIVGESAISAARGPIERLRFEPDSPISPLAAVASVNDADVVLLAPGSLFTSTLATIVLPDIAAAIAHTPATVLWICNLEPQLRETVRMTAADHLAALRRHGVRVDAVLFDPTATLHFAPDDEALEGRPALSRRLSSHHRGEHDPALLHAALCDAAALL